MFLKKIKGKESGVLLYGITPPKAQTDGDKIKEIAERALNRLCALDIDALVVYDVQDESARTSEERPFPFANSLDPFEYSSQYLAAPCCPQNNLSSGGEIYEGRIISMASRSEDAWVLSHLCRFADTRLCGQDKPQGSI